MVSVTANLLAHQLGWRWRLQQEWWQWHQERQLRRQQGWLQWHQERQLRQQQGWLQQVPRQHL
jgi:hypothetical protein